MTVLEIVNGEQKAYVQSYEIKQKYLVEEVEQKRITLWN